MKFHIMIAKEIIEAMFNSNAEINILLYSVVLELELMIQSNVTITMQDVSNKSSHIIEYIPEVSVQIGDVMMWQPFFVLERDINACILERSFEMMT